jgi:hypothetical protein
VGIDELRDIIGERTIHWFYLKRISFNSHQQ